MGFTTLKEACVCLHQVTNSLMKVWSSQVAAWCDHISHTLIDVTIYLTSSINRSCTKWFSVMHINDNCYIDATWHIHMILYMSIDWFHITSYFEHQNVFMWYTFWLIRMGYHTKSCVAINFYQILIFNQLSYIIFFGVHTNYIK